MNENLETTTTTNSSTTQEAEGTTAVVTKQNNTTPVTNTTTTTSNTSTSSSTTTSSTTTPSSGTSSESVKMDYEAVEEICGRLKLECQTLADQWTEMDSLLNNKNNIWQGSAADRYFDEFEVNYKKAKSEEIDTNLKNYVEKVLDLVELNRGADRIINDQDILQINQNMPVISANGVTTNAHTTNDTLNNSVKTNGNIQSNATITDAHTTNDELNNSVKINSNIQASSAEVTASQVNEETIKDVHVNGNIGADSISKTEALEAAPVEDTSTSNIEDIVKAYAKASNDL